ncbi:hypothetical protein ACIG87_03695 [Micromonospora sp. NPDC051925]|uniref:hypothetical protein n=1 Tax=Micromonospora sp. NPDC051925 TaxID=3364288 RepID=UPI0037CB740A
MEISDRPLARFVAFFRDCFKEYARFVWAFYGGAAEAKVARPAHRSSPPAWEKAP